MNSNSFFVSVIIPVYNGEKYLAEAIKNVFEQDYSPLEIIVVDDGSTDNTRTIATQFKDSIHYICQSNSGPAAARNRGIRSAKGDVIAFLDSDDLWSDNKLKLQVSYLAENPTVEIVQGLIQQMQLSGSEFEVASPSYQFINLGSAIYRKSVFEKIGYFDEVLRYGEDTDFFLRAWENDISKVVLDQVTLFYRKHDTNMTNGQKTVELGLLKIFKKHLDCYRRKNNSSSLEKIQFPSMKEYIGMTPPLKNVL